MNKQDAKQNLAKLENDLWHLQSLNPLNSSHQFKVDCYKRESDIKRYIRNIRDQLYEQNFHVR